MGSPEDFVEEIQVIFPLLQLYQILIQLLHLFQMLPAKILD